MIAELLSVEVTEEKSNIWGCEALKQLGWYSEVRFEFTLSVLSQQEKVKSTLSNVIRLQWNFHYHMNLYLLLTMKGLCVATNSIKTGI